METRNFPINFDSIQKGDSWNQDQLIEIVSAMIGKPVNRESDAYRLGVLAFSQRVSDELASRGRVVTVATVKGAVKVLTDPEASIYNAAAFEAAFRRAGRSHFRGASVDVASLDDEQRKKHDNRLAIQGAMLQAAAGVRKLPPLRPTVRNVPGE